MKPKDDLDRHRLLMHDIASLDAEITQIKKLIASTDDAELKRSLAVIKKNRDAKLKRAIAIRKEITERIDKVEDPVCRELLRRRYIVTQKCEEIAVEMHIDYSHLWGTVHKKALSMYGEKIHHRIP